MALEPQQEGRRTVATRVLLSFAVTLLAFAVTVGWSVAAQRRAAADSLELSKGYLPVALKLGQLRATQATLATLIDGLPDERDPVSARLLLGTLQSARHAKFLETKAAIAALDVLSPQVTSNRGDFAADLASIEGDIDADKPGLERLLAATFEGDKDAINREIIQVGAIEHGGDKRLHVLADRVSSSMDTLSNDAKLREARSVWALVALAILTLGVGVFVSLYVRRVLAPLGRVTERAQAVARGDLTPREVPARRRRDRASSRRRSSAWSAPSRARAPRRCRTSGSRRSARWRRTSRTRSAIRSRRSASTSSCSKRSSPWASAGREEPARRRSRARCSGSSSSPRSTCASRDFPQPRMEADDVAALVRDIVAFAKPEMERAGCEVNVDVADEVPPALFDEAQIRQALLNLLRNAREAMPEGGEIDVSVRADGMSVVVGVDDRGAGIPEDVRARIFDPFFSTKGEGTGLGLAITRQIVEAHGGTISCIDREGGGTSFRVALPIAPARAT